MTDSEDTRHLAHEELTAAGVPKWAQQGGFDGVPVPRYYSWIDDGVVDGRLLLPQGSSEGAAIESLLAECEDILSAAESDFPHRAVDLTRPAAVLIIRPNGHAEGGTFHPKTGPFHLERDFVPLERLVLHAVDALSHRLRAIRLS